MADNRAQIIISAKDETQAAFRSVRGSLESLSGLSLGTLFGAASVAGLAAAVKSAADLADEMGKAAQKVGTTTEALSGLKYAADLSDVSFETLQKGMEKLAKTADAAAGGSKEASESFARLKIDPTQFKDTSDLLVAVAEALSKLPDGAQKTALAMQLLGKGGAELIPLLNEGAAGIRKMTDEAERFGVIVGSDTAASAQQFNDNMERLGKLMEGLRNQLGNDILPILVAISEGLVESGASAQKAVSDFNPLAVILQTLTILGANVAYVFKETGVEIGGIAAQLASLAKLDFKSFSFIGDAMKKDAESARKALDEFERRVMNPSASSSGGATLKKNSMASADPLGKAVKPGKTLDLEGWWLDEIQRNVHLGAEEERQLAAAMKEVEAAAKAQAAAWEDIFSLQQKSADFELQALEQASAAEQDHIDELNKKAQAYRELLDPQLKMLDVQAELNDMVANGIISGEESDAMLKKLGETTKETTNIAHEFGATFGNAFEDAIINGQNLRDVLQGLLKDLAQVTLRKGVTDPLFSAFGDLVGGGFSSLFGGARAGGGPVSSGRAYLVGEKGPELFMPATSGSIVPNGSGGGGVSVHIDARGADSAAAARIEAIAASLPNIIKTQLMSEMRPGGMLA